MTEKENNLEIANEIIDSPVDSDTAKHTIESLESQPKLEAEVTVEEVPTTQEPKLEEEAEEARTTQEAAIAKEDPISEPQNITSDNRIEEPLLENDPILQKEDMKHKGDLLIQLSDGEKPICVLELLSTDIIPENIEDPKERKNSPTKTVEYSTKANIEKTLSDVENKTVDSIQAKKKIPPAKVRHKILCQPQPFKFDFEEADPFKAFMEDLENNDHNDADFYSQILSQSIAEPKVDELEWKIREMTSELSDTKLQLKNAETIGKTANEEAEIRDQTIQALQDANKHILKDRNEASIHLKEKSEQVFSLKDSINKLRSSLEEILLEKSELSEKLKEYETKIVSLEEDHAKLQKSYDESLEDLKQLPEYKLLESNIKEKDKIIREEKETRCEMLKTLELQEQQWKIQEASLQDEKTKVRSEIETLRTEKIELTKNMNWYQEEISRLEARLQESTQKYESCTEEVTELRIKLGASESEKKADLAVEAIKSKILVESMQTEIKWREKLWLEKIKTMQKRLDTVQLEKLRVQKQFARLETAMQEETRIQPPRAPTPRNKRLLIKSKYMEMESIDQEIMRLKAEMDDRQKPTQTTTLPPIFAPQTPVESTFSRIHSARNSSIRRKKSESAKQRYRRSKG